MSRYNLAETRVHIDADKKILSGTGDLSLPYSDYMFAVRNWARDYNEWAEERKNATFGSLFHSSFKTQPPSFEGVAKYFTKDSAHLPEIVALAEYVEKKFKNQTGPFEWNEVHPAWKDTPKWHKHENNIPVVSLDGYKITFESTAADQASRFNNPTTHHILRGLLFSPQNTEITGAETGFSWVQGVSNSIIRNVDTVLKVDSSLIDASGLSGNRSLQTLDIFQSHIIGSSNNDIIQTTGWGRSTIDLRAKNGKAGGQDTVTIAPGDHVITDGNDTVKVMLRSSSKPTYIGFNGGNNKIEMTPQTDRMGKIVSHTPPSVMISGAEATDTMKFTAGELVINLTGSITNASDALKRQGIQLTDKVESVPAPALPEPFWKPQQR